MFSPPMVDFDVNSLVQVDQRCGYKTNEHTYKYKTNEKPPNKPPSTYSTLSNSHIILRGVPRLQRVDQAHVSYMVESHFDVYMMYT